MTMDRRDFIAQAARAGIGMCAGASLATCSTWAAPVSAPRLRLCLLSGSAEYKSNESLAEFQKFLEARFPLECTRAFWTSKANLPGLEALDNSDVMLVFTKRLELPNDQLDRIKKYCRAGRPIVGLRTASHAFQNWLEFDREFLGGSYSGHYADGPVTKVAIAEGAADHPILHGFTPFETKTKLYKNPRLADSAKLLLTGTIPEHTEPVAWTNEPARGSVFYTSLGGPDDFQNSSFRSLVANAIFWAAQRKPVDR
jgi:type 1 glutamine amidotransferase